MATLNSIFDLSGSMGNVSFYKRKDLPDTTIARTKGGPSRRKVLTDPGMENTRRCSREFGGVATATKYLLAGLQPLKAVSDLNWAPALNQLLHPIKKMDTTSPWGQRAVCISRAPWLLEGFQLNRKFALETIIHGPLALSISDMGISLTVPALLPGANFTVPPGSFTSYRLVLTAAWVSDLVFTTNGYRPANTSPLPAPQNTCTPWQLTKVPADSCALQLPADILSGNPAARASGTLMISVGILLGRPAKDGRIEPVKHMGAGKVVAMYAGGQVEKYAPVPIQPAEPAGDETPSFTAHAGSATAPHHTAYQPATGGSYDIHDNVDVLLPDHAHGLVQANTDNGWNQWPAGNRPPSYTAANSTSFGPAFKSADFETLPGAAGAIDYNTDPGTIGPALWTATTKTLLPRLVRPACKVNLHYDGDYTPTVSGHGLTHQSYIVWFSSG